MSINLHHLRIKKVQVQKPIITQKMKSILGPDEIGFEFLVHKTLACKTLDLNNFFIRFHTNSNYKCKLLELCVPFNLILSKHDLKYFKKSNESQIKISRGLRRSHSSYN
jgi:hypothetical protein